MPFKEKYCEMSQVDSTCKKEIYAFTAKDPLYHCQWVMQCPDDKKQVTGWDGMDAECRIGYVKCSRAIKGCEDLYVQPGDCVDIVIHRDWGGREMGCKASGWVCDESGQTIWFEKSSKGEIKYYCDPTGAVEVVPEGKLSPTTGTGGGGFDIETNWVCDDVGETYYFVKEVIVDAKTGERTHTAKYYTGPDCLTEATPVLPVRLAGPKEIKESIIETRKIKLPIGVVTDLSPIPADAIGAEIIFEGNACCKWRATWDGSDPTGTGVLFSESGCLALGCTKEAASDPIEVQNFKVIAEDDCEGCIVVSFYKQS